MNYMRYKYNIIPLLLFVAVCANAMQEEKSPQDQMLLAFDEANHGYISVSRETLDNTLKIFYKIGSEEDPHSLVLLRHLATGEWTTVRHGRVITSSKNKYLETLKAYDLVNTDGSVPEDVKKIARAAIKVSPTCIEVQQPASFSLVPMHRKSVRLAARPVLLNEDNDCGGVEWRASGTIEMEKIKQSDE